MSLAKTESLLVDMGPQKLCRCDCVSRGHRFSARLFSDWVLKSGDSTVTRWGKSDERCFLHL